MDSVPPTWHILTVHLRLKAHRQVEADCRKPPVVCEQDDLTVTAIHQVTRNFCANNSPKSVASLVWVTDHEIQPSHVSFALLHRGKCGGDDALTVDHHS